MQAKVEVEQVLVTPTLKNTVKDATINMMLPWLVLPKGTSPEWHFPPTTFPSRLPFLPFPPLLLPSKCHGATAPPLPCPVLLPLLLFLPFLLTQP